MTGFVVLVLLHISSTMSSKILSPKITSSWDLMDEGPQQIPNEPFTPPYNSNQGQWPQEPYPPREGYASPITMKDILEASSLTSLAGAISQLEGRKQSYDTIDTTDDDLEKRSGALPPKRLGSVVELYRSVAQGLQPFLRTSHRIGNRHSDSRVMRELPSPPVFEKPTPVIIGPSVEDGGSGRGPSGSTLVRRSVRRRRRPAACDFRPFTLVCWQTQPNRRKMLNR